MTLYSMTCERCDEMTTHRQSGAGPDVEHAVKHPRFDCWVLCDECNAGRSKADLPEEGADFWVKAQVETGLPIRVHPDMIPDGTSLSEHIETQLKERRGELAREIADGIREGQVEMHGLPESEELSGFPPNY